MATLTVQIVSTLGTSNKTLTFSVTDAQRILTAFQNQVTHGGTQDQLAVYLAQQAQRLLAQLVTVNEAIPPVPPVMT